MARRFERLKMHKLCGLILLLMLMHTSVVFAQGSIFGAVRNADLSTPANGTISFYGFTDNTDDEIRLESSVGAGYDAGNWFDDFQNYLSKTPGNPYMYRFFNTVNGQGAVLAKTIPSNSFQQEDISLGTVTWPVAPAGMAGRVISSSSVVLTWTRVAGMSYHVYRRPSTSGGSFFRIDNPAGLLTNAGIADSFFVDNTATGGGSFDYLLIAQDGSGTLGPHSSILTINTATAVAPFVASIAPNSGSAAGGTAVVINGTGFDVSGATATIGGAAMTSVTVVSPFRISAVTPAGTAGAQNVVVTNSSAALAGTLTGGYTYLGNVPPVLAAIGPQTVAEGATLTVQVSATDPDGTIPTLTTSLPLPTNASFVDHANGTGTFTFSPNFTQAGSYSVTFFASDGIAKDSQIVPITVTNTDRPPVMTAITAQTVNEGSTLNLPVSATDPDGTIPTLTTSLPLPTNASFVDNANGTGTFTFSPTFGQAGSYTVTFFASDGTLKDSQIVSITVVHTNRPPVMTAIGPQSVNQGQTLTLPVAATDPDGTIPTLTTSLPLPANASFVDHANGTGTFSFTPAYNQTGPVTVTFFASDGSLKDSQVVAITIVPVNVAPVMHAIGAKSVGAGSSLSFADTATDANGTIPVMTTSTLPTNATFVDNGNGVGTFTFNPDFTQVGPHVVTFYASDGTLKDSQVVTITVLAVNRPPVMTAIGSQTVAQGQTLTIPVAATDPDGTIPALTTSLPLPANASFVDSANGHGLFTFRPAYNQTGPVTVTFYASDGTLKDSQVVAIGITFVNVAPKLATIGPKSLTEGQILTIPVSAVDSNGTIPTLSTSTPLPSNASFVDSGNGKGEFTFAPNFSQAGSYTVTFFASDGVLKDSQIVAITVIDVGNVAPVIAPIPDTSVNEGATLLVHVVATDADGGSVFPALSVTTGLSHYTFVDSGNGHGLLTYTPNYYDSGVDTVHFFATDFGTPRLTGTAQSIITTFEVNQAPSFVKAGPYGVLIGDTLTFNVTATDSTAPNPNTRMYLSVLNAPANSQFADNTNNTGTFRFAPISGQLGVDTVNFVAVDQGTPPLSTTMAVIVTVQQANNPPVLAPISAKVVTEGVLLTINASATDPDGTVPTLSLDNMPYNASFTQTGPGTATFSWTPNFVQGGNTGASKLYYVTFKASDGFAVTKQVVLIQVKDAGNQRPVFDSLPAPSVTEGQTLVTRIRASDPDSNTVTMGVVTSTLPTHATFADSGKGLATITFSPDYRQAGVYDVSVFVNDGTMADTGTVVITVIDAGNQPPVLDSIATPKTIKEMLQLAFRVTATDVDGGAPKLTTSTLPRLAEFVDSGNGHGGFVWPTDNFLDSTYHITFYAEDSAFPGVFDSQQVTIVVLDSNLVPFVATTGGRTMYEGDTLRYIVYGSDPDNTLPLLRAVLDTRDTLATNMTFLDSLNGVGLLTFTPSYTQGALSPGAFFYIRFLAKDARDTTIVYTSPTVQIKVLDKNAPPQLVFQSGKTFSLNEGGHLTFDVGATDLDGTVQSITTGPLPANASWGASLPNYGTFTFNPDFTQAGAYSVKFYATDNLGAKDSQTVSITVIEAGNQPPSFTTILADTINFSTTSLKQVYVHAVDPERGLLTLTAAPMIGLSSFVDSGNGSGVFSWQPDASNVGSVTTVTFTATDPLGATATLTTHFRVLNFLRGDMDANNKYTINDLSILVSYLFRSGPKPPIIEAADTNADTHVDIEDVVYMINFLYYSGPRPPQ